MFEYILLCAWWCYRKCGNVCDTFGKDHQASLSHWTITNSKIYWWAVTGTRSRTVFYHGQSLAQRSKMEYGSDFKQGSEASGDQSVGTRMEPFLWWIIKIGQSMADSRIYAMVKKTNRSPGCASGTGLFTAIIPCYQWINIISAYNNTRGLDGTTPTWWGGGVLLIVFQVESCSFFFPAADSLRLVTVLGELEAEQGCRVISTLLANVLCIF